jgi:3-oxoacyl-[acyl-carrier protein] reductase
VDPSAILITGGTSGLGRAIVERLAAEGKTVAFSFRSDESAARELAASTGARAFAMDITDRNRVDEVVEQVEEELGPIEGLVNNAGVAHSGLLAMTSDEDWSRLLDVNLGGAFRCTRAVLPRMISRRRGAVLTIASLAAIRGRAGQAAYAASKAGVIGMTRALAREVGKRNIRVNALLPGFVSTAMTRELSQEAIRDLKAGECLPGGVSAADVAAAAAFLLSDQARAITGQGVVIDAGISC